MSTAASDEMGPIDYLVLEWPGRQPKGEAVPHLIDLVDRGIVRILDLAFIAKDGNGAVNAIEISELAAQVEEFAQFVGAASGLLSEEDFEQAAGALEPGTLAALIVYENSWAAPLAGAVRRSGGQVVASGRIPIEEIEAALDAAESAA